MLSQPFNPYGRGDIDPDTGKKGRQVELTIADAGVFTTPWSGLVTYRPVTGDWQEVVCAENPHLFGTDAGPPTAETPDFQKEVSRAARRAGITVHGDEQPVSKPLGNGSFGRKRTQSGPPETGNS